MGNRLIAYPSLQTKRINLRILELKDAEEVFRHFSDEQVTKYMDIQPCKDISEAEEMITYHLEDIGCRWGIFDKTTNSLIGTCGYHYFRKKQGISIAEIGYDLGQSHWGKGIMSEVLRTIIDFGFTDIKLDMIDATVEPENIRSIQLLNKLGFEREEDLQDQLVCFSLSKENWMQEV